MLTSVRVDTTCDAGAIDVIDGEALAWEVGGSAGYFVVEACFG